MTKSQLITLISRCASYLTPAQATDLASKLHPALCYAPAPEMQRSELDKLTQAFLASGGKITKPKDNFTPELRTSAKNILKGMGY